MSQKLTSSIVGFAIVAAVVMAAASTSLSGRALEATKRTVYVSVLDKDGAPVTDIQAADLDVKEGGKTMEIVSVKQATTPLRIAIIDSDAGSGAYQAGLLAFLNKLLGNAEFSLTSVIVQAKLVHDYSSDRDVLVKGLEAVGRRGTERGGQLMEAIMDVTKNLRAEGKRSILLVLRAGGEAASTMPSSDVKAQLRKTGATMYAVSFKGVDQKGTATAQTIIGQGYAGALREEEQTTGANNLQQVLGDGTKESGGHYDEVVAVAASKTLEAIGNEILHQYEVVYAVPDGVKPSDKLAVSPKRKGVTLYAPSRPPM